MPSAKLFLPCFWLSVTRSSQHRHPCIMHGTPALRKCQRETTDSCALKESRAFLPSQILCQTVCERPLRGPVSAPAAGRGLQRAVLRCVQVGRASAWSCWSPVSIWSPHGNDHVCILSSHVTHSQACQYQSINPTEASAIFESCLPHSIRPHCGACTEKHSTAASHHCAMHMCLLRVCCMLQQRCV